MHDVTIGMRKSNQRLIKLVSHSNFVDCFWVSRDLIWNDNVVTCNEKGISLDISEMDYFEHDELKGCYITEEYLLVIGDYLGMYGSFAFEEAYKDYFNLN